MPKKSTNSPKLGRSKSGQARTLTAEQVDTLFKVIMQHRYPEKNSAIMQISFKLGLRVQEIALLQVKEVAKLNSSGRDFSLNQIMSLPAAITKGANATAKSQATYERKQISFSKHDFDQTVRHIEQLVKAGVEVNPEDFYPELKKHHGKSRDLPLVDDELRRALIDYLYIRIDQSGKLKPSDTLFITQKGGPYSPGTLKDHMTKMLRDWAGIEKASSHSGRRTLITNVIHKQGKSVKVAQKIAGHVNPSTTLIYEEPPEDQIEEALKNI